ncbi:FG-nucleoporin nsp1 [Coemansia sp. BCRC 34301]|nr:FG-nucleoporin nsp1 [Coemansia sp. BCRC 34301]
MTAGFSLNTGGSSGGFGGFGGFGSFGANAGGGSSSSSNLFGAKSGDEAKPAAATAALGDAPASKSDTSKSTISFNFGNSPAVSTGNAATPTPAAPLLFGAGSTAGSGNLFGAKPASGTTPMFGSANLSTAASAPASAPAPAPSMFQGFGGLGTATTTAASSLSTGSTASTAPAKSIFGGFSSSTTATTATAVPVGSMTSASATDSKAAPFGVKSDATNPTAGTGLGGFKLSTAPVVSGAGSSDGKMTGTATPAFGMSSLGLSSSATPTAAASSAPAAAGTTTATAKIESSTDLANAALRGKTLEEIAQMWTLELTAQTRAFHTQASTVSYWDRALVQQGKRITELYDATMAVEAEQAALDQSLGDMEGQQNALENLLNAYEGRVQNIVQATTSRSTGAGKGVTMSADEERDLMYSSAERLNMQLDELTRRLSTLVEDVNSIPNANAGDADGQRGGGGDPLENIFQILNLHLTSLHWVEEQTSQLQDRVKNAQRVLHDVNAAQTSIAGAYGGGTAAVAPASDDAYGADSRFTRSGGIASEPLPPVTSSFGTPMATARKPPVVSTLGRPASSQPSGLRTSATPASPFGSTPLRRGF